MSIATLTVSFTPSARLPASQPPIRLAALHRRTAIGAETAAAAAQPWVEQVAHRVTMICGKPCPTCDMRRMMEVLMSDVIPDPRDVVIICLADACALWRSLIHPRELDRLRLRIAQIVKLDLIGQSVTRTIRKLQVATRGLEAKWFK